MLVYVLVIQSKDDAITVVPCTTHELAIAQLYEVVKANWTREGLDGPVPENVDEAIEEFFDDDGEWDYAIVEELLVTSPSEVYGKEDFK